MIREHFVPGTSPTPSGTYSRLDYIMGFGSQYIDLGPESSSPNGYYAKLTVQYVNSTDAGRVIGAHNLSNPYGRNGLALTSSGIELSYGDVYHSTTITKTLGVEQILEVQTYRGNAFVKVNGTQVLSNTNDYGQLSSLNILVLQDQWRIQNGYGCLPLFIKRIEFTNGSYSMDLYPTIRLDDNVPGLYDAIHDKFYTNAGSGDFLYHGSINYSIPSGYQRIDYIEGTGAQWIDTGFCATGGDIVDFEWSPTIFNDYNTVGSHNPSSNSSNGYNRNQVSFIRQESSQFSKCNSYDYAAHNNTLGVKYHIIYNSIGANRIGLCDDVTIKSQTNTSTLAPVNNIAVLHNWYNNTNNKGKLHSARIYNNQMVLVRNYIPLIRTPDSKPGLYDLCGSTCPLTNSPFYTNSGTGEFLYA